MDSILIVRLSALGDTALTLPLLFALRRRFPGVRIGWAVGEAAAPLLQGISRIDRLHVWRKEAMHPAGLWRFAREIKGQGYQVALDTQGLTVSALIPWLAGIKRRVGFVPGLLEGRELAPLFINHRVSVPADVRHVSARIAYLGRQLDRQLPITVPVELPRHQQAAGFIDAWWSAQRLTDRTMVFGIGAGWPTKVWPVVEMRHLVHAAADAGYRCVVLWGPYEQPGMAAWRTTLGARALWAPPTNIPQMVELLRRCARYAGPDSAALHLAWLLGKPTFSWFGASDPARCAPPGPGHNCIAKGPHDWHRKRSTTTGLHTLTGVEAAPIFEAWLHDGK